MINSENTKMLKTIFNKAVWLLGLVILMLSACTSSENSATEEMLLNRAPIAVDDTFTIDNGSSNLLNLAGNDSDAEGGLDLGSISIISMPANGTLQSNNDGTVEYTHDGSNTVTDQFTYTIRDVISAVSSPAMVSLTITPLSGPATTEIGIYDTTVVEGDEALEFVVSLTTPSNESVSVEYATVNGTAEASTDYVPTNGTLVFQAGETRKFVAVDVLENTETAVASSKNMQLQLTNPLNAQIAVSSAIGTIIDRDFNPTDNAFEHDWAQIGAFTSAESCGASCHKASNPVMTFDGEDVSPGTQWQHSVMAHSFTDPYWQATVEDEADSFPHLSGFIENTCLTCHAPMGVTHAHATGVNLLDADNNYRFDTAKDEDHAREGVSCTACHQIGDGNLGTADSFSGGFSILTDAMDPNFKKIFGPYANPAGNNMNMQTGHRPTAGVHMSKSEMCATCHTLYTPTLDADSGLPTGDVFLEQAPFLEWQNSVYASGESQEAQCQDCHMSQPQPGYSTPISLLPANAPDRSPYGQHTLLGGNAHLLEILRDYRDELGISDSTSETGFDRQIALTRSFLQSAASVSVLPVTTSGEDILFDVQVSNHTGHKLPSSYPSRRMWLHVRVSDDNGQVFFESGKPDAEGNISTDDARLKADCMSAHKLEGFDSRLCYAPHYDVISEPSEVAIFETVLGDSNGQITHTLLNSDSYLKDNRIPPVGFTTSKANTIEPQTLPSGISGDDDFNCLSTVEGCGKDTVHYRIDFENRPGPYYVEVNLLFQSTHPAYVNGLHNHGDRVNRFKVMYDEVSPAVELLASATN